MANPKKLVPFSILILSSLLLIPVSFTANVNEVIENKVTISSLNNMIIISTDSYEFHLHKDSVHWNVTRRDFNELSFKHVGWKLYYNGTAIAAKSNEYNASNGERYFSNSTFENGIFLNFTCVSNKEKPDIMEYFWFYPKYFIIQLSVTHKISGKVLYIEKAKYIDDELPALPNIRVGEPNNTNFVFWGYKRRYQAQEVADAEPPVFIYSNETDVGLVMAQFKPNWTHRVKASYISSLGFILSYEQGADTTNADDIKIATNERVTFDKVFFQFTSADINQAFKDYALLYSQMHNLRPNKGSQTYWLTWYADGGGSGENVTEANVLSNATWIRDHLSEYYRFNGVLIDAIICDEVGDWLNYSSSRFPSGIDGLVDQLHDMGLKVGLWIAPLCVEKDGWINRTRPEAIAKNKKGELLFSQMHFGQVKHDVYYLNPFNSWIQNRLRWVNQNISAWGLDFVKLDFLAGTLHELYMKNQTRYMVMEQTYKAITAGFNEKISVLACTGEFYNPAIIVNYVDRIWLHGPDLWHHWSNLIFKYDVLTQLIPFIRHFYITVDPDSLGRLSSDPQIPFYVAKFYSTYATVSGGTFEISERLSTINNDSLALYKKHLPFVPKKWRPIEWKSITRERPPRIWLYNTSLDGEQHYYVAVFNPQNSSKTITIDLLNELKLQTGTYLVLNQYNSSFLGEYSSSIDINLDANQTIILTLIQKTSKPRFLMRSDHVTASAEFISASFSNSHLTITLLGNHETLTPMIVYSPNPPFYVLHNDSFITRLADNSSFDISANPCWYYDSANKLLFVKAKHNLPTIITVSWVDDIPTIWEVRRSPEYPEYDQNVLVTVNVTEPERASGIANVTLYYSVDDITWFSIEMTLNGGLYEATIPGQMGDVMVEFYIKVYDNAGNHVSTPKYSDMTKPAEATPKGLPTFLLVGVGVGVALLIGIAVYFYHVKKDVATDFLTNFKHFPLFISQVRRACWLQVALAS